MFSVYFTEFSVLPGGGHKRVVLTVLYTHPPPVRAGILASSAISRVFRVFRVFPATRLWAWQGTTRNFMVFTEKWWFLDTRKHHFFHTFGQSFPD